MEASYATDDTMSPSRQVQWLREVFLGASDGLVSTAALMLGICAAADLRAVLLSGRVALIASACSMAFGEYVSVHTQLDVELAELKRAEGPTGFRPRRCRLPPGAAVPLLAVAARFIMSYKVRVAAVVASRSRGGAEPGSRWTGWAEGRGGRVGGHAITYGLVKLFRTHGV